MMFLMRTSELHPTIRADISHNLVRAQVTISFSSLNDIASGNQTLSWRFSFTISNISIVFFENLAAVPLQILNTFSLKRRWNTSMGCIKNSPRIESGDLQIRGVFSDPRGLG